MIKRRRRRMMRMMTTMTTYATLSWGFLVLPTKQHVHTHIHVQYPRTQAITTSVSGVARHCTELCASSTPQVRSQRLSVASTGTALSCVPLRLLKFDHNVCQWRRQALHWVVCLFDSSSSITTSVSGVARHCTVLCAFSTPQARSQRLSVASPSCCVPLRLFKITDKLNYNSACTLHKITVKLITRHSLV